MKLTRFATGLCLLAAVLFLSSCEPVPMHTFYISEEGCILKSADGDRIEDFWVFPGDLVIIINTAGKDMTVKFATPGMFEDQEFTIARGTRVKYYVKDDAEGTFDYTITPCDGAPGTPKGNVGDNP
ncbi:MAG: hypothetical protein ABIA59_01660 [Candidatus Latescibacterota bacterium]